MFRSCKSRGKVAACKSQRCVCEVFCCAYFLWYPSKRALFQRWSVLRAPVSCRWTAVVNTGAWSQGCDLAGLSGWAMLGYSSVLHSLQCILYLDQICRNTHKQDKGFSFHWFFQHWSLLVLVYQQGIFFFSLIAIFLCNKIQANAAEIWRMLLLPESVTFIVFRTLQHGMFTQSPGLLFPLPLCLLSFPSRSHSNGCSAVAVQGHSSWSAWLWDSQWGCSECSHSSIWQPQVSHVSQLSKTLFLSALPCPCQGLYHLGKVLTP